jgi:hypothetical protein
MAIDNIKAARKPNPLNLIIEMPAVLTILGKISVA